MQRYKIFLFPLLLIICQKSGAQQTNDSLVRVNKQLTGAFTVSGVIKDAATGKALRGIRVTYKDYSAVISDSTGSFVLEVPSPNVSVLVEGEGYQSKQIALKGQHHIAASLYEDTYTSFYDVAQLPLGPARQNQRGDWYARRP